MDAVKSVPWVPSPAPAQAVFQGVRLDQRSCEQFRSVCKSPAPSNTLQPWQYDMPQISGLNMA